jgi:hypothetical protein
LLSIFRKLDPPREETENRRAHAVLTFLGARTPCYRLGAQQCDSNLRRKKPG